MLDATLADAAKYGMGRMFENVLDPSSTLRCRVSTCRDSWFSRLVWPSFGAYCDEDASTLEQVFSLDSSFPIPPSGSFIFQVGSSKQLHSAIQSSSNNRKFKNNWWRGISLPDTKDNFLLRQFLLISFLTSNLKVE